MRHRVERKLYCVKVIKIKNIPRKEREACRVEVELLRRLNHPNIVGYKESFLTRNKESLCIVMEYCDGGDLCDLIKKARRSLFSEAKVLHWFVQMALGLHYMHSNRILHRDLKTQNIFLLGNGRLVLGDLGISKVLEGTMDFAETCIGTPYYMSPEIFKNKPYNHKSDIWALGCVLYELVTLNHAFDAASLNGLAAKIIRGRYPPISTKYSRNLRSLIDAMLDKAPANRPDLEDILRMPFIKKHIQAFFSDIVSRPASQVGEGTMVVRDAALRLADAKEGPVGAPAPDVASLRRQLTQLGLTNLISRGLAPPETKQARAGMSDRSVKRLAREQRSALRREEERRKAVEQALSRLRSEREQRQKQRQQAQMRRLHQGGYRNARGAGPRRRSHDHGAQRRGARDRGPVRAEGVGLQALPRHAPPSGRNGGGSAQAPQPAAAQPVPQNLEAERRRVRELDGWEAERRSARGSARSLERQRQQEEFDKLRAAKADLDRREAERRRVREERRRRERERLAREEAESKLEERRREQRAQEEQRRAAEASARERVMARKRAEKERLEQEHLQRLRAARQVAYMEGKEAQEQMAKQYHSKAPPVPAARRQLPQRRASVAGNAESEALASELEQVRGNARFDFGGRGAGAGRAGGSSSSEGRASEGGEVNCNGDYNGIYGGDHGGNQDSNYGGSHDGNYDGNHNGNYDSNYDGNHDGNHDGSYGRNERNKRDGGGERMRDPFLSDEEADLMGVGGGASAAEDSGDGAEDGGCDDAMDNRQEELEKELQQATQRCEELRKTLQATKSFIGAKASPSAAPAAQRGDRAGAPRAQPKQLVSLRGAPADERVPARQSSNYYYYESSEEEEEEEEEEEDTDTNGEEDEEERERTLRAGVGGLRIGAAEEEEEDECVVPSEISRAPALGTIHEGQHKRGGRPMTPDGKRAEGDGAEPIFSPKRGDVLADPISPGGGRLGDRIRVLQERCEEGLGEAVFGRAYAYLKRLDEEMDAADGPGFLAGGGAAEAREDRVLRELTDILGEDKLHYWSIIDQLLFMQATHF